MVTICLYLNQERKKRKEGRMKKTTTLGYILFNHARVLHIL